MASNYLSDNGENSALNVIERCAINSSGRLGSLYDGYRDCMLGQLSVSDTEASYGTCVTARCRIIKSVTNKRENFLRLLGVERELQLSILLNLTSTIGIASLIDYSQPICELTRILHFRYVYGEERLRDNVNRIRQSIQRLIPHSGATHIVTGVSWGLYMVVILQLPTDVETIRKIDDILEKIRIALESVQGNLTLETVDENLLATIADVKIYSNAPEVITMTTLYDACRYIDESKNGTMRYPITYTLQSIPRLPSEHSEEGVTLRFILSGFIDHLIAYLLNQLYTIKNLGIIRNEYLPQLPGNYLKGQLYDVHKQWSDVNEKYKSEIERLSKLVVNFRHRHTNVATIKDALEDNKQVMLKNSIAKLTKNRDDLETKLQLILDLQHFKYCDVADRDINGSDTKEIIERKLNIDVQHDRILCTDDVLNKKDPNQLLELRQRLEKEYESDHNIRLIYADFSYTSCQLYKMMILPSINTGNDENPPKQNNAPSSKMVQPPSTTTDIINILLLGETGVGKSTFINALVNYLTFDSLKAAESSKPVVLIPVSFVMTTGDNFQEHTIELDNIYKSDTENFNTFGQSVTQYCKSYILQLKHNNGRKLRIIDTPGFGDTRGIEQDDRNMQHILEYINNLTHLDAVCFLLKPNAEKLNIFFRSCITQLLDHLGQKARENIIFCFTNARATFYTPGNTSPLLKNMLSLLSMGNIPFKKENTFCFDSESFRYLVALQKNISFKNLDRDEYEKSWLMSTKESNRLMDYIRFNLMTYHMQSDRQSIKNAQFEIIHMLRPILETTRNILRNIILWNSDLLVDVIELHPKPIYRRATQCLACKPNPIQVGKFWIPSDFLHEIQENCLTCQCASDQHIPIEYMLNYICVAGLLNFDEMQTILRLLFNTSIEFSHFLKFGARLTGDDLFMTGLTRMVEEEKDIVSKVEPNDLNLQLVQQLENIIRDYKRRMNEMKLHQEDNNLPTLYNTIKTVSEHPMISKQMAAIKEGQEIMMKQHEYIC